MRIIAISCAYGRRGGGTISRAAHYLRQFVAPVSPANLMIEAESFHHSTGPTRLTLEALRDRFDARYELLPRLRYLRKSNKVILHYRSTLTSDVAQAFGKTHPQTFRTVLSELCEAIEVQFSSSRSLAAVVDLPALRHALSRAAEQLPQTDEAVSRLIDVLEAEGRAERLQPMTMDRLPVDWSRFHPSARTILNDPLFWDEADDDAPQGNDTGADLLPTFRRWRARNRTGFPMDFLNALLKKWGLLHDEPTVLEAKIGLAFAQIKLEGRCDPEVAAHAVAAIDRRLSGVKGDVVRVSKFRRLRERVSGYSENLVAPSSHSKSGDT